MGIKAAALLMPIFEREKGRKGRISLQTNPTFYRNAPAIIEQAMHFDSLAPNIQVKVPATNAGITAAEEVTYRGLNLNATVCFTIPQAIAVAEAVERGLNRRKAEGKEISTLTPVCTMMIGRLDDWMKVIAKKQGVTIVPGHLDWAGIAAIKKAYGIFQRRGYRTRLLAAAYRHHMHWSELIGGDIVMTIPYDWQVQFNQSDLEVKERMQDPVDPDIVSELCRKFPDFGRAYDENGMTPAGIRFLWRDGPDIAHVHRLVLRTVELRARLHAARPGQALSFVRAPYAAYGTLSLERNGDIASRQRSMFLGHTRIRSYEIRADRF